MTPLGIGLIGVGGMGQAHVSSIVNSPESARLVAICDQVPQALDTVVNKFDLPDIACYTQTSDLLARPDIDLVIVIVPHHLHHLLAVEVLQSGHHLLMEKPLCNTSTELACIEQAMRRSGKQVFVGFNKRYHQMVEKVFCLLAEGCIGQVRRIRINDRWHHTDMRDGVARGKANAQPNWRAVEEFMGEGGILNDTSAHSLSLAVALAGDHAIKVVHAAGSRTYIHDMDGYDSLWMDLACGDGTHIHIDNSWAHTTPPIKRGGLVDHEPLLLIDGDDGSIVANLRTVGKRKQEVVTLYMYATEPDQKAEPVDWVYEEESILRRQLRDIAHCLQTGTQPRNDFDHGHEVVLLTDQARSLLRQASN